MPDARQGGGGGGGWSELPPAAHATDIYALDYLERYKRVGGVGGTGKSVLERFKYAHNDVCESCDGAGDLVDCDYCNCTWHNTRDCLMATDGTRHEPFDTDAVIRSACPECWKEAMAKFKVFQTQPTYKKKPPSSRKRKKT